MKTGCAVIIEKIHRKTIFDKKKSIIIVRDNSYSARKEECDISDDINCKYFWPIYEFHCCIYVRLAQIFDTF
jgi:hypothetical protein